MAANRRKPYPTVARDRIQSAILLERLQNHVVGQVEMSATQVQAARILLGKVIPDLKAIEHTGEGGGPVHSSVTVTYVDAASKDTPSV